MTLAVLIAYLVRYFEEKDLVPVWKGYVYAASVSVCALILTLLHHQQVFYSTTTGWHMRTSICALMYKKVRKTFLIDKCMHMRSFIGIARYV